ncbi:acyl-CoA dehydrogenase family protein [Pseudonocardia kunmingensis]|uniref:Acyl-CoA dehydrogenase n=1 Tax=Pseudonocardia kunmingensis TaxID=630975 RepID=A0A543D0D5_9PSEU|nr:acyl-CoA dehydrogenase family protein [Pseudonocardia kunmingensis]TQM02815.1 acyl-CoA dehydrogenase [Pseudonocardia kunmingensis]
MSAAPTVDPDLVDLVDTFFRDTSGHEVVAAAEESGMPDDLWSAASGLGLTTVGLEEAAGGAGGSLLDTVTVLRTAARHAAPLPLAEHHVAGWLLAAASQTIPPGPLTVATDPRDDLAVRDDRVSGTLHDVAWLPGATAIVTVAGTDLVVVPAGSFETVAGRDLAGMPRGTAHLDGAAARVLPGRIDRRALSMRTALLRSAQLAGLMEAVDELTRRYVAERVQFGKPIGAFQAVQHRVVTVAQMAAMSALAVDQAALAAMDRDASFEITATKLVVSENASTAARAAHQAHGAIGMTREYRLQQFTRRLVVWRSSDGAERGLAPALGTAVAAAPSLPALIADARPDLEVRL